MVNIGNKWDEVLEGEFDNYWNTDKYNLLGCNLPDGRNKEILEKYCDRTLCKSFQTYEYAGDFKRVIFINSKLLDKRNIRRLTGNHYLVLFQTHFQRDCAQIFPVFFGHYTILLWTRQKGVCSHDGHSHTYPYRI